MARTRPANTDSYVFAGVAFPALIALVTGGGYILCGYWMRRA